MASVVILFFFSPPPVAGSPSGTCPPRSRVLPQASALPRSQALPQVLALPRSQALPQASALPRSQVDPKLIYPGIMYLTKKEANTVAPISLTLLDGTVAAPQRPGITYYTPRLPLSFGDSDLT